MFFMSILSGRGCAGAHPGFNRCIDSLNTITLAIPKHIMLTISTFTALTFEWQLQAQKLGDRAPQHFGCGEDMADAWASTDFFEAKVLGA